MTRSIFFGCLSFALLAACGGAVETGSSSNTSSAGSGSGSGGSGSGTTTSAGSGGGSGGGSCSGSISFALDGGESQLFTSVCAATWNPTMAESPIGYIVMGGPAPGIQNLVITGCAGPAANSEGLTLSASHATSPGTYNDGAAQYTDPNGSPWGFDGDPFELTLVKLGEVGDSIEGNFKVVVTHTPGGNAAHTITGIFHVCRIPDELVP